MSNTSVFDQRLAYRPAVVDLFTRVTEPEIQRAADDIAKWQTDVNALNEKIADAKRYISELRQARRDIEASADLPALTPPEPITCRTCGLLIVERDSRWVHAGRELLEHGDRCNPKDKQSPTAAPVGQNTAATLLERIETAHDSPDGAIGMTS